MDAFLKRLTCLIGLASIFMALEPPSVSQAGFAGSKHDFSATTVAPGGACGACHVPHYAKDSYLWTRGLTEEKTYFNQTASPNFTAGDTIPCYDCHDNHGTVDNDPPDAAFLLRIPQDVAFDDDMATTTPRDGLPADNRLGYYEKPVAGTRTSGHYVKNPPGGGSISQGDKLPCNDCHSPHDATNQAFVRKNLADKTLVNVKASTFMAYKDPVIDGRNDTDSRKFCIACHGTSEQTTEVAVTFSKVNPGYGTNKIAVPPTSVSAHGSASVAACTSCHKHNNIAASCEGCHDGGTPLAPNVMTFWAGSVAGVQDGGHGDPGGAAALACTDCHDLAQPASPAAAQHGNGIYNSIWANDGTRSSNTAHLRAGFFTEFPANGPGDWGIQVAFDNYCAWKCHDVNKNGVLDNGEPTPPMRHSADLPSGDPAEFSVEFGTHLTPPVAYPNPDLIPDIPIDTDVSTVASGPKHYAPCISCHDPHGTGVQKPPSASSNSMLRFTIPPTNNILCSKCHR